MCEIQQLAQLLRMERRLPSRNAHNPRRLLDERNGLHRLAEQPAVILARRRLRAHQASAVALVRDEQRVVCIRGAVGHDDAKLPFTEPNDILRFKAGQAIPLTNNPALTGALQRAASQGYEGPPDAG